MAKRLKQIAGTALIMMIALILLGCSAESEQEEKNDDSLEAMSLEVVYHEAGWGYRRYGAGNTNGYYDIDSRIWDLGSQMSSGEMDSNIVYIDYATKNRVYLCNDPSCRHNNDSCTSYIKAASSVIVFPVGNEKIVCLRFGKEGDVASNESLAGIIVMQKNGSDRKEICTLDPKETFAQPLYVASDGSRIYIVIQKTVGVGKITRSLYSVDITTGEREEIVEIPNNYYLSTVYDDCFLFTDIGASPTALVEYSLSGKEFIKRIEGVSGIFDGSRSLDIKYDIDITDIFMINEAHSITVVVSDAKDGSVVEYGPFELEDDHAFVSVSDFIDDHVFVMYVSNVSASFPTQHWLSLNLSTGEIKESSLFHSSDGKLVGIYADAGDKYLVGYDTKPATLTYYDREGVAHEVYYPEYLSYALIKKTDYYANNGIFEPIEDATVD